MSASMPEATVAEHELLARYIVRQEHLRADGTVKPDPFIPYKWVELSVTRHLTLTEEEIWAAGESVALKTNTILRGRADRQAFVFTRQRLRVVPAPEDDNRNHANVIGWPRDKQAQKEIALELVRDLRFIAKPSTNL